MARRFRGETLEDFVDEAGYAWAETCLRRNPTADDIEAVRAQFRDELVAEFNVSEPRATVLALKTIVP